MSAIASTLTAAPQINTILWIFDYKYRAFVMSVSSNIYHTFGDGVGSILISGMADYFKLYLKNNEKLSLRYAMIIALSFLLIASIFHLICYCFVFKKYPQIHSDVKRFKITKYEINDDVYSQKHTKFFK